MSKVLIAIYSLNRINLWHNYIESKEIFIQNNEIFIGGIEKMILNKKINKK